MSTTMVENITQHVREYILNNFMVGAGTQLADSDSLIERQIVDSTGFLELITFLEESYGFHIADEEMVPENLETLANIERFVRNKRGR